MAYGAAVKCRCLQDLDQRHIPSGIRVTIDACGQADVDSEDSTQSWERIDAWLADVCPHAGNDLVHEVIANASGMANLRSAVTEVGGLPILERDLPSSNDGCVPACDVGEALAELEDFRRRSADKPLHQIVDVATGQVIRDTTMTKETFQFGYGFEMGLDADGLFILEDLAYVPPAGPRLPITDAGRYPFRLIPYDPSPQRGFLARLGRRTSVNVQGAQPPTFRMFIADLPSPSKGIIDRLRGRKARKRTPELVERFRARRGHQEIACPRVDYRQPVTFSDLSSGRRFDSPFALTAVDMVDGEQRERIPAEFQVVTVPRPIDYFDYAIVPLRNVLTVAVQSKSAVTWT